MSWFPKQKVVVPIDFSDESIAAVNTALELVTQPDHLHVVHVLETLSAMEPGMVWASIDDETRENKIRKMMSERFDDPKYEGLQMEVLVGDPGHEIAGHAKNLNAELIVMPSHGRRGISHLLIGSVAERVIRLAHCPVLILRQ